MNDTASKPENEIEGIIDLARYPVHQPGSSTYDDLVGLCRASLSVDGASVLEGFFTADAISRSIREVTPHIPKAFSKIKHHSPYLVADDPAYAGDHPRNRKQMTSSATLAYDHIPADSALNRLYLWTPFQRFLADVLDYEALYPYADTLTPLNILVYEKTAELGWHFDLPPFVVTLTLQQSEAGGTFLYAPFIRADNDENFDGVDAVLRDRSGAVHELRQPPGALVIFRGNRTLHRVTRVDGETPRLTAAFSYSKTPGTISDEHNRMTFYGRTA